MDRNVTDGYIQVPINQMPMIPCCDFWPAERLTSLKIKTYEYAKSKGYIFCLSKGKQGDLIAVKYLSPIPHDWIKQWLKEISQQLSEQYSQQISMHE